jgi:hypothetical protein
MLYAVVSRSNRFESAVVLIKVKAKQESDVCMGSRSSSAFRYIF